MGDFGLYNIRTFSAENIYLFAQSYSSKLKM